MDTTPSSFTAHNNAKRAAEGAARHLSGRGCSRGSMKHAARVRYICCNSLDNPLCQHHLPTLFKLRPWENGSGSAAFGVHT